jgi:hypothetical protein
MKCRSQGFLIALLASIGQPRVARAGMPSITLTDIAKMRLQAISFFLVGFLLCAWVVQRIWNSLRGDFPRLPRLSIGRATGVVALWGLLFLLVLTMISGARELMTPGAWQKEGLTYKLAEGEPRATTLIDRREAERRQALDRLRVALWTYARSHDGRFPVDDQVPEIPGEAWRIPDPSGMHYVYMGGLTADRGKTPLVYEPGIFGRDRLELLTDGEIKWMSPDGFRRTSPRGVAR